MTPEKTIRQPFDVHCHFFNKEILSLRLLIELGMVLSRRKEQENLVVLQAVSQVKRILHFLKTGMFSVEKLYASLAKDEKGFAFCPLMFDLEQGIKSAREMNMSVEEPTGQMLIDRIGELLTENSPEEKELKDLLAEWEQDENTNKVSSDRFKGQEKQLEQLARKYPERIFPFFAVDPRRSELFDDPRQQKGIQKIVSRLRMNGGMFAGIKLYAPNGYSPTDRRLLPLYEYCEAHQIPMTAHCSAGGFATFASSVEVDGFVYENGKVVRRQGICRFHHNGLFDSKRVTERAELLNHPKIWDRLLQDFPKLKLDLAHFGSKDSGRQMDWTDCIWDMMQRYPNLYTDFSCITEKSELEHMYKHYFAKADPAVKSRFLYGSDYYLNLLFCDGMPAFMKNFKEVFSPEEWEAMTTEYPIRFLKTGN